MISKSFEKAILFVLKTIVIGAIVSIALSVVSWVSILLFINGLNRKEQVVEEMYYTIPDRINLHITCLPSIERVFLTIEERIDTSQVLSFDHSMVCLINNNYRDQWTIPYHRKGEQFVFFWTDYNSWSNSPYYKLSYEDAFDYMGQIKEGFDSIRFGDDYHRLFFVAADEVQEICPLSTNIRKISQRKIKRMYEDLQRRGRQH